MPKGLPDHRRTLKSTMTKIISIVKKNNYTTITKSILQHPIKGYHLSRVRCKLLVKLKKIEARLDFVRKYLKEPKRLVPE